jgi:hypothetical protein
LLAEDVQAGSAQWRGRKRRDHTADLAGAQL